MKHYTFKSLKSIFILFISFIVVLLYSCSDDSNPANSNGAGKSNLYFSGIISDVSKYYEDGKDSCNFDVSGNSGANFRFYNCSFKQIKETTGDEAVSLTFPNLIEVDSNNWDSFFVLGDVPFANEYSYYQKGYVFSATKTTCESGTCHTVHRSCFGEQSGSYLKIVRKEYIKSNDNHAVKLDFEIKCKLYTSDGYYTGQVQEGKMSVLVYL